MLKKKLSIGRYFFLYLNLFVLLTAVISFVLAIQGSLSRLDDQIELFADRLYEEKRSTLRVDVEGAVNLIDLVRRQAKERIEEELIQTVLWGGEILRDYHRLHGNQSNLEDLQRNSLELLRHYRYMDGEGYFFAFTPQGIETLYPIFPEKEGLNNLDWVDMDGNYFILEMIEVAQSQGQGFVEYRIERPGMTGRSHQKLAYILYIEELDLILGSGYYLDNLEFIAQERVGDALDIFGQDREEPFFGASYQGLVVIGSNRGINRITNPVGNSAEIIAELSALAQSGGGYMEYEMPPLDVHSRPEIKLSYVLPYPDWNWYVGTGGYITDLSDLIEEERNLIMVDVRRNFAILIIVLILIYGLLLLLLRGIAQPVRRATESFIHSLQKSVEGDQPIPLDGIEFAEYESIARATNEILKQKNDSQRALFQKQKLEAIGRLAGGVAHDINNQLTAVMGYADLIATQKMDSEGKEYLDALLQGAHRASDLVRDLLAFSRKNKAFFEEVDIHEVLAKLLHFLERTVEKGINIQLDLQADPCTMTGDSTKLYSLFLNLAINGIDAMEGEGQLTISTGNVHGDGSPGLYVDVRDSGVGIPKEIQDKVFELFFTTKPPGKGTGLGLAQVYDTIKEHQGSITLDSSPGEGTLFHMEFPLKED